jgi:hypothetical protein
MTTKRPSFLKRQKEMKRNARALEKREARKGRKEARAAERNISVAPDPLVEGTDQNRDPEL